MSVESKMEMRFLAEKLKTTNKVNMTDQHIFFFLEEKLYSSDWLFTFTEIKISVGR